MFSPKCMTAQGGDKPTNLRPLAIHITTRHRRTIEEGFPKPMKPSQSPGVGWGTDPKNGPRVDRTDQTLKL